MDNEIVSTKKFFKSHNITLSDLWLESCIAWCREENPNSNYTLETLHLTVYQQWLLLDLRHVEVPILPANLAQQKKVILNGVYPLQLLHVIDISVSKLTQIQKLRKSMVFMNATDFEEAQMISGIGKRMLQLTLTDGVQNIEAIEYKPVPVLNINLLPGVKIKLTGPIVVRRGQILLEEKHVSILGGEVEELLVSNASENVMACALNLPINPTPNRIDENNVVLVANNDVVAAQVDSITNNVAQRPLNVNSNRATVSQSTEWKDVALPNSTTGAKAKVTTIKPVVVRSRFEDPNNDADIVFDIEDNKVSENAVEDLLNDTDIFDDMDIDSHLDMIDQEVKKQNTQKGTIPISTILKNRNENNVVLAANNDSITNKVAQRPLNVNSNRATISQSTEWKDVALPNGTTGAKAEATMIQPVVVRSRFEDPNNDADVFGIEDNKVSQNAVEDLLNDTDIFEDMDIDSHLDMIDQEVKKQNTQKGTIPISTILKNRSTINVGKFKIRAKFNKVVEKLIVTNDTWVLKLLVTDETGDLETFLHGDIISDLMGYCPSAMLALKEDVLSKNEHATNSVMQAIAMLKKKIMNLDCVMEISFSPDQISPTIINLKE